MVGAHHQFGVGEDLAVPLVRNADPDNLFRYIPLAWLLVGQYINSLLPRSWTSGIQLKKTYDLRVYRIFPLAPGQSNRDLGSDYQEGQSVLKKKKETSIQ